MADDFADDIVEELIARLGNGEGLATICRDPRMPARSTIQRWMRADDELAQRVMEARELGFQDRAERAVEAAKSCEDPIKGRLAFDAERWLLGKLSQALGDKPVVIGALVNVDADNAFAAVTGALEVAAGRIASSGTSTRPVVVESEARSGDADRRLANLAGDGGARLGQDESRG
jgi:hypothetical protein